MLIAVVAMLMSGVAAATISPQATPYRATTIAAVLAHGERYHGEWVTVAGTITRDAGRTFLSSGDQLLRVLADGSLPDGDVELSGQVLDVGRVRPRDRRAKLPTGKATLADMFPGEWPQPGQEIVLVATRMRAIAQPERPAAPLPLEVYFSTPVEGEGDVRLGSRIRLQLSRDVDAATLAGRVRVSYSQTDSVDRGEPQPPPLEIVVQYNAASRSIEITPRQPLERFRPVVVELLDGIRGTDASVLRKWTLHFTTGGS